MSEMSFFFGEKDVLGSVQLCMSFIGPLSTVERLIVYTNKC